MNRKNLEAFAREAAKHMKTEDGESSSTPHATMTTREIVATFKEMYSAEVSATLISKVTDAVIEQVIEWQSRPLDAIYPIVYLDCIVVKIRQAIWRSRDSYAKMKSIGGLVTTVKQKAITSSITISICVTKWVTHHPQLEA